MSNLVFLLLLEFGALFVTYIDYTIKFQMTLVLYIYIFSKETFMPQRCFKWVTVIYSLSMRFSG